MLPGALVHTVPYSVVLYSRGNEGAGAKPTNGQVIALPLFSSVAFSKGEYMNPADGSIVAQDDIGGTANQVQRFPGVYLADVFIFQDVNATLALQERTFLRLLDSTGATNQLKTVITRVITANVAFRETFRIMNAEARFQYTNGALNTTTHDFHVTLRIL